MSSKKTGNFDFFCYDVTNVSWRCSPEKKGDVTNVLWCRKGLTGNADYWSLGFHKVSVCVSVSMFSFRKSCFFFFFFYIYIYYKSGASFSLFATKLNHILSLSPSTSWKPNLLLNFFFSKDSFLVVQLKSTLTPDEYICQKQKNKKL